MAGTTKKTPTSPNGGSAGQAKGKSELPRLGSKETVERPTLEIDIPDQGVSVLLRKPSVEAMVELQEQQQGGNIMGFASAISLIALMLEDPDLNEEQLREAVEPWSFGDWLVLQEAALRLSGMSEEVRVAAEAAFRDSLV